MFLLCIGQSVGDSIGNDLKNLPEQFLDNGDGTVIDIHRGLRWQKCGIGQTFRDEECQGDATPVSLESAIQYCDSLALMDKKWRLPNIVELESLYNYFTYYLGQPGFQGDFPSETRRGKFWSHNTTITADGVWKLVYNFHEGYRLGVQGGQHHARCITDDFY